MMRYLIKVTYTDGAHAGKSYLLSKGGYVTDESDVHWEETTYKTLGLCRHICKLAYEDNEQSVAQERADNEWRLAHGKEPYRYHIYDHCSFEPYAVEIG